MHIKPAAAIFAPIVKYLNSVLATVVATALLVSCGNDNNNSGTTTTTTTTEPVVTQPPVVGYQLINTYPHDSTCFTEGLQYVGGNLLESGGQWGKSDIRYTDLKSGKLLKSTKLDKQYFGEGCSVINGKVYQMTYEEKTCFVYDSATLKQLRTFNYNFGEGWGMTTNGHQLIISNGGSNLYFYDPETFKELKRVGVTNQYGPVSRINELELIKGYIYANVWMSDQIYKIDTSSGKVVAIVNLEDLRGKAGIPKTDIASETGPDVMNGIAYDSANDRIFITGKYWPKLFEVKFDQ